MSYFKPGFVQDPNLMQPQFTSMEYLVDAINAGNPKNSEDNSVQNEDVDIQLDFADFDADYAGKLVSTNEICSQVSDILGRIFPDFAGCREAYSNGRIYIELGFDIKLGAGQDGIRALETLKEAQANNQLDEQTQRIMAMTNSMRNSRTSNGYIDEDFAGFRMTDMAITILKKIAISDYNRDDKHNKDFRTINIAYEYDQYTNKISLIVRGMTLEKAMSLVYGDKYQYKVTLGAQSRRNDVGYVLEVRRIKQSKINELQNRYVGTVVGNDRFVKPRR